MCSLVQKIGVQLSDKSTAVTSELKTHLPENGTTFGATRIKLNSPDYLQFKPFNRSFCQTVLHNIGGATGGIMHKTECNSSLLSVHFMHLSIASQTRV
jgi:hypothetical protein